MDTLNVIDVHPCIQGEGRYAGVPHILIRTTGCNLHCMFANSICDTAYASWKPEAGSKTWSDIEQVLDENSHIEHTFITGGEPTIHPQLLNDLVTLLKQYGHFVSIETNGTNWFDNNQVDFITISPKLSSSIPIVGSVLDDSVTQEDRKKHEDSRLALHVLSALINRYDPHYQMKFVFTGNSDDVQEILLIQDHLSIPNNKIYLMPEGPTNDLLEVNRQHCIDVCLDWGFNYTDRLHIVAYGNTRIS